jgi:hypothetical protein
VSTDQNGNFRVGEYFKIDQATGTATLNANAFNLAGLTSLRLGSIGAQLGESINEFSSDVTMAGNSNIAVPTEAAVKAFVESSIISGAFDSSSIFKTNAFDYSNVTFDANGNISAAVADNITYSNIIWYRAGTDWAQFGGTDSRYWRLSSFTETYGSTTKNITLNYNATTNLIDTITVV